MARNLSCGCLCHGSNGNRNGDEYFSCKNCYGANHMDHLPRVLPTKVKAVGKDGPRKPRKVLTPAQTTKLDVAIKTVAKEIMNDIAAAAEELKANA